MLQARLPPPVLPGDSVGIAALSGMVNPERLREGLNALQSLGFHPILADNLSSEHGVFAGPDRERLESFHRLVSRDDLKAVFFARGGYGIHRLLPLLDWELIGRRPLAWIGYSDLTPFLLEIVRRFETVTFHGPMVAADLARGLSPEEEESLLGALRGDYPRALTIPRVIREGIAQGPLMGGCLSLLTSTLATPWAPPLEGALVFVEEVGEPAYRIDRMLTHLRLSGTLKGVQAMVFGNLDLLGGEEPLTGWMLEPLESMEGPIIAGMPWGHGEPNWTLPLGLDSRVNTETRQLVLGI